MNRHVDTVRHLLTLGATDFSFLLDPWPAPTTAKPGPPGGLDLYPVGISGATHTRP
jgi:hypothetical protein